MVEVGKRFHAIGLGRLDQAVGGGAGLRSTRGIGKEPVPASDRKGTDGVFRQGVADIQSSIGKVTDEQFPLVEGVLDGLIGQAVPGHPGAVFLQPGLEVIEHRLRQLLTLPGLFFRRQFFDPFLDGVEFADLADGHVGLADLRPFLFRRRRLAGFDELAPCVIPAARCGSGRSPGTLAARHGERSEGW